MADLSSGFARTLRERADHTALIWDGRAISFGELDQWSAALVRVLSRHGVGENDRLAVGLPNSPLLVAAVLAAVRSGAVIVPINPHAPAGDARYVATHSEASAALVTAQQAGAWGDLGATAIIADDTPPNVRGASTTPWVERGPADDALLMYTSGTTGLPKGVVLSHGAVAGNLATVAGAWRWTAEDRLLLTLPCFHLHGLALGVIGSLLVGSSIVLRDRFAADEVLPLLAAHRCTLFFGVPTMYNRLVQLAATDTAAADSSAMRLWVSGSAPLTAETFEEFRRRFGHEILERFGMSEGGFMIAAPLDEPRRPGVVGRPLAGIDVRIIDPDARGDIVEVACGEIGEIAIRGPNLFSMYWRDPAATRAAFAGPYFRSGDLAVEEDDGMIRIVGRISVDIIKCRGFKIGAVEIENFLQRHRGVAEVAVVGVPHADLGEEIVAVVTPSGEGVTAADLIAYARGGLAAHKVPARVVFKAEIPRTGPGKFKKRELIEELAAAARPERAIGTDIA